MMGKTKRLVQRIRKRQERTLRSLARMQNDYQRSIQHLLEVSHGVRCKWCGSTDYVLYGHYQQQQRYMCKACRRKFGYKAALPHMQTPAREVGDALSTYYGGMSLRATQRHLQQQYNNTPSDSTIYRWVTRFSKVAIDQADKYVPNVGDEWVADETMLKIGGQKVWLWDIIDSKTRFLLATKLSLRRTTNDAYILMQRASNRAGGKVPRVVYTDALAAYIDGIEWSYGSDAKHVQTKPFTVEENTNLIERFHSTLKTRTRVMRGMKRLDTANLLLNGWLVQYNFFRPHESLNDRTPAEVSGIKFDYANWLELVEKQHSPVPVTVASAPRSWARTTSTFPRYKTVAKKPTRKTHTNKPTTIRRMSSVVPALGQVYLGKSKSKKRSNR